MNDKEFNRLADEMLAWIEDALDDCGADVDVERQAGGVLQIECVDGSKLIINRHAVAQEIWVAARAGGFHFRWQDTCWCDTRDGRELVAKLNELLTAQCGEPVSLADA